MAYSAVLSSSVLTSVLTPEANLRDEPEMVLIAVDALVGVFVHDTDRAWLGRFI